MSTGIIQKNRSNHNHFFVREEAVESVKSGQAFHFMDDFKCKTIKSSRHLTRNLKLKSLVLGISIALSGAAHADLNDGLVAYYPFDGNAQDMSGNSNHGMEYGGVGYTTGKIGQAAQFDGMDDYIEIVPQSDVSQIGDFTIVTWVLLEDWKIQNHSLYDDRQYIFNGFAHSNTTTSDFFRPGFSLIYDRIVDSEEIHNIILYDSATTPRTEQNTKVSIGKNWHQLLFMRRGDKDFTYFDGKFLLATYAQTFTTDTLLNMAHNWFVGTFSGNNPNYRPEGEYFNYSFLGLIDDLRIYNRALSEAEIQELFEMSSDCQHAVYDLTTREVTVPFIDIPLISPIDGKLTGEIAVFSGKLQQTKGVDDFTLVEDSFGYVGTVSDYDPCHAKYTYSKGQGGMYDDGGKLEIPFVEVPSFVPTPFGPIMGPTNVFNATLRQLAVDPEVFHLEEYNYIETIIP